MHSPRARSPSYDRFNGHVLSVPSGVRRQSGLTSRATQILAIRFGWVVLVIWYEVGEFFHSLSTCKFPDSALRRANPPPVGARHNVQPTHVVLLADPHVPHPRLSYPEGSRPWVNALRQGMDELFMRKSWNVVMRLGRVDAVIVVGDMLDWGRGVMDDVEYEDYFSLFHSIFRQPSSVPMYFVPGNHDLPLGPNRLFSPYARDRYAQHFSPPNVVLSIANHSLILLDAVGLVEEDYRRYASEMQFGEWDGVEGGVIEFVKALGDDPPPGPKVLISHIPLARPEASTCGPLRERGRILKGAGPGYQNLLGSETSKFLLDVVKPSIIFSGDDHDYCEHTHPSGIREVTLKSFSSSAGIRRPGFQLLSLVPPSSTYSAIPQLTHADRPCFLPDQAGVYYRVYIPFAILTIVYLLWTNIRTAWAKWNAAGHSIYGDLKARISPAMPSADQMPPSAGLSRRVSERPVPLSLPSRKSSQYLPGLGQLTPNHPSTVARQGRFPLEHPTPRSARSAPVSPSSSPRPSYADDNNYMEKMDEEAEAGISESSNASPSLSRRSSYIYMSQAAEAAAPVQQEPSSYFLPLPGQNEARGLGLTTPTSSTFSMSGQATVSHPLRRVSSSNLSSHFTSTPLQPVPRRVTMPRMLSTADWSAAAKAKEKSMFGLMVDSLPVPGAGRHRSGRAFEGFKSFVRWLWKSRNGVVLKSWRETLAVAWPAALVWVGVNALFFYG